RSSTRRPRARSTGSFAELDRASPASASVAAQGEDRVHETQPEREQRDARQLFGLCDATEISVRAEVGQNEHTHHDEREEKGRRDGKERQAPLGDSPGEPPEQWDEE